MYLSLVLEISSAVLKIRSVA